MLSAREQRTLDSIKGELAETDPQLAALLAMFGRLVSGEAMPACGDAQPAAPGTRRRPWRRCWRWLRLTRSAMLPWLLICVSLITIGVVLSHLGGASSCATPTPAACAAPASSPAATSPGTVQAGP